mmetsp:Transcript_47753/g.113644  ORF Transcript_47753/g.113644 Transcript_47753/m.113644 type:complete len:722 (+) Transcript_47753:178-2343(+)
MANFKSLFSTRPAFPKLQFEAESTDGSLSHLLSEAFAVIERRFGMLDKDGAGMMMYAALEGQLSLTGFNDNEKLRKIFQKVDLDRSGALDFSEFLCMLFLWATVGTYTHIFESQNNSNVVAAAFTAMENHWAKYDADKSRKWSVTELNKFLVTELPELADKATPVLDEMWPEAKRKNDLPFTKFMHLLYVCSAKRPETRILGTYVEQAMQRTTLNEIVDGQTGPDSRHWMMYQGMFGSLTQDFKRFDKSGDGYIDYTELSIGVPLRAGNERLFILSRLEHKFRAVDIDGTESVDFYEFMYLCLLMSQDGSYTDLVPSSEKQSDIMRAFVMLCTSYKQADKKRTRRLKLEEVHDFFMASFGAVPDKVTSLFNDTCYESSQVPGEKVVDVIRLVKLLYFALCPEGEYGIGKYKVQKIKRSASRNMMSVFAPPPEPKPTRIAPVISSKFKKGKKLGEGGQGAVYLGTYEGNAVAGKEMFGKCTKEILDDLQNEVTVLTKMDHPNCHFLIGAKLLPDADGGPLLLTEICEEGSFFDLYAKKRLKFDAPTSYRIAHGCAAGMEHLHGIGYMHRDIKSLNIFMSTGLVPRVADFGMATSELTGKEACGTVQWMAPEVLQNFAKPNSSKYDRRCDIYSYGVLCWEIFHCRCPYAETGLDQMQIAAQVLKNGIRPRMSSRTPPKTAEFIKALWNKDPSARIQTFTAVLELLEKFKPDIEAGTQPPGAGA